MLSNISGVIIPSAARPSQVINIVTRVWTKSEDYWTVYFDIMEQVKTEFDKAGIEIPFNQVDVHIRNDG